MRHRVNKHHFNRDTKSRSALIKNLLRALIEHGSIVTTYAKAKEIKKQIDKLITIAKGNSLVNRRVLHEFFGKRDVVNTLVDRIAPLFVDRQSGFTTITNFGKRRGDNAVLAQLSLLKKPELNKTLKAPLDKQQKNLVKPKTKIALVTKTEQNKVQKQSVDKTSKPSKKVVKKVALEKKPLVTKTKSATRIKKTKTEKKK